MLKKIILLFAITSFTLNVFSQEFSKVYASDLDWLCIDGNEISFSSYNLDSEFTEKTFNYESETVGKLLFIINTAENEKYLFLKSEYFATLFIKNNTAVFPLDCILAHHSLENPRFYYSNIRNSTKYSATSELIENNFTYEVENLGETNLIPWVENAPDSGIGQTITMEWPVWKDRDGSQGGIGALIFLNGFISFDKPYLYEANNRIKEIRLYSRDGSYDFQTELDDTPNPQIVFLPVPTSEMCVEIKSVYKGNKWNDTCINSIFGLENWQARSLYEDMLKKGDKILGYKPNSIR